MKVDWWIDDGHSGPEDSQEFEVTVDHSDDCWTTLRGFWQKNEECSFDLNDLLREIGLDNYLTTDEAADETGYSRDHLEEILAGDVEGVIRTPLGPLWSPITVGNLAHYRATVAA